MVVSAESTVYVSGWFIRDRSPGNEPVCGMVSVVPGYRRCCRKAVRRQQVVRIHIEAARNAIRKLTLLHGVRGGPTGQNRLDLTVGSGTCEVLSGSTVAGPGVAALATELVAPGISRPAGLRRLCHRRLAFRDPPQSSMDPGRRGMGTQRDRWRSTSASQAAPANRSACRPTPRPFSRTSRLTKITLDFLCIASPLWLP